MLRRSPGTLHVSSGWFSLSGVGGHGSLAAGLLISIYIYSGWDGTLYVNEEVRHRRENPGPGSHPRRGPATGLYELVLTGLQGVVFPHRLQAHSTDALVYVATTRAARPGPRSWPWHSR